MGITKWAKAKITDSKKDSHEFCRKCLHQAGKLQMVTEKSMGFECNKCHEMWVVRIDNRMKNNLKAQEGFVIVKKTTKNLPSGFLHGPGSQSPVMKGIVKASGIKQIKVDQTIAFREGDNTTLKHEDERLWVVPYTRIVSHGDV